MSKAFGQNLVPNPSFESYTLCPHSASLSNIYASAWTNCGITPDYFNACCTHSFCGIKDCSVPYNYAGYQLAASGQAYCGLVVYVNSQFQSNVREFIGAQLLSPLTVGVKYYVSFKACRAIGTCFSSNIATNKLGIKFSMTSYNQFSPPPLNNFAHIFSSAIISDTTNWTMIKGSFVADQNYTHILVGNFFNDINTDTLSVGTPEITGYYFVDDFVVGTDSLTELLTDIEVNDNTQEVFQLLPNPSQSSITVQFNNPNRTLHTFKMYDLNGTEVFSISNISSNTFTVSRNGKPEGIYYYQLQSATSIIKTGRLIFTD